MNITDGVGGRSSVYPPAEGLTFFPYIYMVPQYHPDDVLMLGYGGGTTAGLIRTFYGQSVPITAVDLKRPEIDYYNVQFVQADANEYIRSARKFDVIIVDVYPDGENQPCEFVMEPTFVVEVFSRARYVIVHAKEHTNMAAWGKSLKVLALNDSRFYYYMVERVGKMPIR